MTYIFFQHAIKHEKGDPLYFLTTPSTPLKRICPRIRWISNCCASMLYFIVYFQNYHNSVHLALERTCNSFPDKITKSNLKKYKKVSNPIDMTPNVCEASVNTGTHPASHWWTSCPERLTILGMLGPQRSMSKRPT